MVYNEVNSPAWWKNTACNTQGYDPVYYYGGCLNQAYDALNRLSSKTYPDTTAVDYIYDLAGKIQQVSDPTGTLQLSPTTTWDG